MSEQAQHAHDDPQLLARISQAANQAGLGAHRAAYPAASNQAKPGCMVAVMVALGVAMVGFAAGGYPAVSLIAVVPLLIVLFGFLKGRSVSAKNEGARLDLFEHGLTSAFQGRLRAFRYDSTTVLQHIVRHTRNGVHTHTTYAYTLTDTTGESTVLREGYARPTEWGPAIQESVTRAQLPTALAALNAGQRVTFGDLWMSREEVGSGVKSVRWPEIQEVKVHNGYVTIKIAGKWRGLTTTMVRQIPNFFVFLTLAERLRESWGGAPRQ
ncbi:hypothetical protein F0L68_16735 [Solihabitans fulvus]|uniref:Uncharacterized protein n=1 Tax=Solihabitans fulvus TaxID=1892852 RepID=A0A5B2XE57_9PSEU|nr:DUF6585 family protein [Solihabitans fulvus]KAA2261434.1 hypothetical protein F0L68_16735 [Solihabitans fulvus]